MNVSSLFLIVLVLILGLRHGLDLDHLATIDAITRGLPQDKKLPKWVGLLFSLGHGLIVILVSLLIGSGLMRAQFPHWLNSLGHFLSIFFLLLFGSINLISLFRRLSLTTRQSGELKAFLAKKIIGENCTPVFIIAVGAIFALSFDTFTQVSLFSLSAATMAGWVFSGVLGVFFMLGMMMTDGLNGVLVSSLIKNVDKRSYFISRILCIAISFFSLTIGGLEVFKLFM